MDRCRALLMVAAVALGLAGCGDGRSGREQPAGQADSPGEAAAAAAPVLADPCSLVTKAEVEGVVRQAVVQEAQQGTCLHRGDQPGSTFVTAMTVAGLPSKSPGALGAVAEAVAGLVPGAKGEPVPGVGDDARVVRTDLVTLLFVRSGDRYLTVSVTGSDDPVAAAKALALRAIERL